MTKRNNAIKPRKYGKNMICCTYVVPSTFFKRKSRGKNLGYLPCTRGGT